jgi:hypothetical protein
MIVSSGVSNECQANCSVKEVLCVRSYMYWYCRSYCRVENLRRIRNENLLGLTRAEFMLPIWFARGTTPCCASSRQVSKSDTTNFRTNRQNKNHDNIKKDTYFLFNILFSIQICTETYTTELLRLKISGMDRSDIHFIGRSHNSPNEQIWTHFRILINYRQRQQQRNIMGGNKNKQLKSEDIELNK